MKNKFKLLSLISALAIGAATTLTACGDTTVGEHDHDWDNGTVTTEPTCYSEGKKTYNCKVEGCEQTKSEPVAMIAHTWNNGEVTKQAKCNEEGTKTYTCTVEGCGKTKEETMEKTAHRYGDGVITVSPDFLIKGKKTYTCLDCETQRDETVEAHADFSEQFYTTLTESNNWLYGYANSYDKETGAVDFVRINEAENGVWKAEKAQIGKGYVYAENTTVIAYSFNQEIPEKVQTGVYVSFSGEESATRLNAYLIINGGCVELNKGNTKDWSYQTEEALDIAQGDTVYLVLENNGEGKTGGNLSLTLTPPCLHVWDKGAVTKTATCTEEGVITYNCVSCDKKITEAVAKAPHEYNEGEITKQPTKTEQGEKTYTCGNCSDKKVERLPKLFSSADYTKDFSLEAQGSWQYGYATDYVFDAGENENKFTFHQLTDKTAEAWVLDNGIEIKSDWLKSEANGKDVTVRYVMPSDSEVNIALKFTGSDDKTRMAGRLNIQKADGTVLSLDYIYNADSNGWTFEKKVTLEAGDTISVLFFHEGNGGYFHGKFSMELNQCKHSWNDGEVTTAATCHSDGVKTFTCENCGETYTEAITERPNHDFTGDWINTSADGHYHKCRNEGCDATDTTATHTWGEGVVTKPATDEDEGSMKYTCTACGYEKTEVIPALTHQKGTEYGKDDDNHWFTCSEHDDCGTKFEEEPHDYTEHLTDEDKEATCQEDGYTVWQCVCGKTEKRTISASPDYHNISDWKTDEATGLHYKECSICHEHFSEYYADFNKEFTLENQDGAWGYGYMEDPWNDNRHFEPCTDKTDEAWIFNNGEFNTVEIKSDWIAVNKETTISYKSGKAVSAKIRVEFEGAAADTLMGIRIFAVEGSKLVEKAFNESKNNEGKQVVELPYLFKAGETIYVMFSVATWSNTNGHLNITVTPYFVADFNKEFTLDSQDGAWGYGYMEDPWNDDNRHFEACTDKTGDAWIFNNGEFNTVEIKSDWIAVNKETTLSYKSEKAVSAKVRVEFDGADEGTLMSIRIYAVNDENKFIQKAFNNTKNEEGKQVVEIDYNFEAGETIYVMFGVENWGAATNGNIKITITQV